MTYDDIVTYVTDKVGETGDYAKLKCLTFAKARHRLVFNSFDWTAAQDTVTIEVTLDQTGNGPDVPVRPPPPIPPHVRPPPPIQPPPPPPGQGGGGDDIPVDAEKIISARFNGVFLDPVTASYIFESHPEMFINSGTPEFYWTRYLSDQQSTSVRLFPAPDTDGTLELLVKRRFDDSANELLIPNIEDVIITFVLADMWEFMRQLGIYAQKLTEAQALLTAAQQSDVPSTPKPRTSKNLTASGETLVELVDSVCDVIGRWEPDIRESTRDRIRRNYTQLWDTLMLPESLVIANVPIAPSQEQVILPYFFDRVIDVRTNQGGPITQATVLKQAEISYYFNVQKDIFEQAGDTFNYSMLSSVGCSVLPPFNEPVEVKSDAADPGGGPLMRHPHTHDNPDIGTQVFIKGESTGFEVSEIIKITKNGIPDLPGPLPIDQEDFIWDQGFKTYDTPLTISKEETLGIVTVRGATSKTVLVELGPKERERKHLRVWLLPNQSPQGINGSVNQPGSVLILGKRRVSQLIDDLDSPQLRNISNILINAAAADMFDRLGNDAQATKYSAKTAAQIQTLVDADMKQSAYQPVITPYVSSCEDSSWDF
jgi:hypothetical protein